VRGGWARVRDVAIVARGIVHASKPVQVFLRPRRKRGMLEISQLPTKFVGGQIRLGKSEKSLRARHRAPVIDSSRLGVVVTPCIEGSQAMCGDRGNTGNLMPLFRGHFESDNLVGFVKVRLVVLIQSLGGTDFDIPRARPHKAHAIA
jgi:hypothetical protein